MGVRRGGGFNMRVVDENLIVEAGRRLAAAGPGAQVILVGSHARGEGDPHSDVDFADRWREGARWPRPHGSFSRPRYRGMSADRR